MHGVSQGSRPFAGTGPCLTDEQRESSDRSVAILGHQPHQVCDAGRLLFVSRAVGPQTTTVTASIPATAGAANRLSNIGGVPCQGQGLYLQILEGARRDVNHLYARIPADRRHRDVEILLFDEVGVRRFANWSMARVDLSEHEPMVQMQHPDPDPYSASAVTAMALLKALLALGQVIDPPDA